MKLIDIYRNARRSYLRMKAREKFGIPPVGRPLDRFHKPDFKSYGIAHWFDALVPRLARALMEASGAKAYYVGGPYGLCSEFIIELYDDEAELEKDHLQRMGKRLTFRADNAWDVPSKMMVSIINFDVNTGEDEPGSIAEVNRMNYPSIHCCPELTMGELLSFFHDIKPLEVFV